MKGVLESLRLLLCSYLLLWTMDIVPSNTPEGLIIADHLGALSAALLKRGVR